MKICPKCDTEHDKSGTYCSRSCANSRSFTKESRDKKSDANKKYWSSLTPEQVKEKTEILVNSNPRYGKNYLDNIFAQEWELLGIHSKRLRVILEQHGKCNKCGLTHWNDKRITLEYEHIDGDNTNNSRDNVEALCPNCHSQTPTWRGRKRGISQRKVEEYLDIRV
jgi:hypothetical protein